MRIIGGALKRRQLRFPKTRETRPTTDRTKETIFNVLGTSVESSSVLDLYAGSGSLGIEALSRGAREAHFVDSAKTASACIQGNLEALGLQARGHVIRLPVEQAIQKFQKGGKTFDLVFSDPPYNKGLTKKTLHQIERSATLRVLGVLVAGHSNREGLPDNLVTLQHKRSIKIGQAFVSFFQQLGGA